jgi:hypothetical protein
VALDGDTAVIGAPDEGSLGAAYVFTRNGNVWSLQQKLTPGANETYGNFGHAVALDGDTAVIGARFMDGNGAAYVFTRSSGVWTQQQRLKASDGRLNYTFGYAVTIEGETLLVGDPANGLYDTRVGAVYVFTRSAGYWTQQQLLEASDQQRSHGFGTSLVLDADTAIIGAPGDDNVVPDVGAAYVFSRVGGVWTPQQKLLASDGVTSAGFGYSVALDGETAVIGAYLDGYPDFPDGSAYVFIRSGASWIQLQKLTASDGAIQDYFGLSVAINGNTVVIGAYGRDDNGVDSGSGYVFLRSGATWAESLKLLASDGAPWDNFAEGSRGVSTYGGTVLIGAPRHDSIGSDDGAAYVYELILDTTPPLIQSDVTGTLGNNGWYLGNVQVNWTATDLESAISTSTGCGATAVTTDTAGVTFTCSATSDGGTSTQSVTVRRDSTPPTAVAARTPAANANGWNNSAVTVTSEGADSLTGSGIANCTAPIVFSTDGANQTATGSCTDIAGNASSQVAVSVSVDRTAPTATVSAPANGASYQQGAQVTAAYNCNDATSGIASCGGSVPAGSAISTGTVGTQAFTVTATDRAGNVSTSTVTYTVSKKSSGGGGGALNLWSVIGLAALAATRRRRDRARRRSAGEQRPSQVH